MSIQAEIPYIQKIYPIETNSLLAYKRQYMTDSIPYKRSRPHIDLPVYTARLQANRGQNSWKLQYINMHIRHVIYSQGFNRRGHWQDVSCTLCRMILDLSRSHLENLCDLSCRIYL